MQELKEYSIHEPLRKLFDGGWETSNQSSNKSKLFNLEMVIQL